MIDVLNNADKIELLISEIDIIADAIPEAAEKKASGISNYDRELALTVIKIKNRIITTMEDFHGERISIPESLAANLIEKIAKGIIYKASFDKEDGDASYKGLLSILDARKAQLNGRQSINRVLQ